MCKYCETTSLIVSNGDDAYDYDDDTPSLYGGMALRDIASLRIDYQQFVQAMARLNATIPDSLRHHGIDITSL